MRNQVHKICAILALTLIPSGLGCAAYHLDPTPEGRNPASPLGRKQEGRKPVPHDIRMYFAGDGSPYPDPASHPLDHARLVECGYDLRKYFKSEGGYDPGQVCEDYARRINAMCQGGRTLVILIHGFCNTYPEASRAYKAAQRQIHHQYPNRKFAFLEIYWDGLYGSPLAIWPQAMNNSKWAGLGLRNLLCRLDPAISLRVLTHSRGSSVICAALWNTPLRSTVEADARYLEAQRALPPPVLPSIRIGLLAPAMRPMDFECYFDRGTAAFCFHDRIILGINPDDEALNAGGLSWLSGTSLGCNPGHFESFVAPLLNRDRAHAFAVDFSGSVVHAFEDYVLRDEFEDDFLSKLLGDESDDLAASPSR